VEEHFRQAIGGIAPFKQVFLNNARLYTYSEITTSDHLFSIYDVSDMYNPILLDTLTIESLGQINRITHDKDKFLLSVNETDSGLVILNMDKDSFIDYSLFETNAQIYDAQVINDSTYLLCRGFPNRGIGGYRISNPGAVDSVLWDIPNPSSTALQYMSMNDSIFYIWYWGANAYQYEILGTLEDKPDSLGQEIGIGGGDGLHIKAGNNVVYVKQRDNVYYQNEIIYTVNCTDPGNAGITGQYPRHRGPVNDLLFYHDTMYIASNSGIHLYNAPKNADITYIDSLPFTYYLTMTSVNKDYLYGYDFFGDKLYARNLHSGFESEMGTNPGMSQYTPFVKDSHMIVKPSNKVFSIYGLWDSTMVPVSSFGDSMCEINYEVCGNKIFSEKYDTLKLYDITDYSNVTEDTSFSMLSNYNILTVDSTDSRVLGCLTDNRYLVLFQYEENNPLNKSDSINAINTPYIAAIENHQDSVFLMYGVLNNVNGMHICYINYIDSMLNIHPVDSILMLDYIRDFSFNGENFVLSDDMLTLHYKKPYNYSGLREIIPRNSSVSIDYELGSRYLYVNNALDKEYTLTLYNAAGRYITMSSGNLIDLKSFNSGIYFAVLRYGDDEYYKQIVILE
ncbi:MAG: T9SS type A sorting domain-containing protein, partial [candidate division WOR-3 bacterium]|nr:T9SS type A sorting domain-containing protein [candidate division WOR-3 bacterium]